MFTTRENTVLWVRAQQQVRVKEEMCFILRTFHGLIQKLHGLQCSTLWCPMHLPLLCHLIVTEVTLIHSNFVEENRVVIQLKKHCCLEKKKKTKKWWEKCNFFWHQLVLCKSKWGENRRTALNRSTVSVLLQWW